MNFWPVLELSIWFSYSFTFLLKAGLGRGLGVRKEKRCCADPSATEAFQESRLKAQFILLHRMCFFSLYFSYHLLWLLLSLDAHINAFNQFSSIECTGGEVVICQVFPSFSATAAAVRLPHCGPRGGPPWEELCSDQLCVGQWHPFSSFCGVWFCFIMLPELMVVPFIFSSPLFHP